MQSWTRGTGGRRPSQRLPRRVPSAGTAREKRTVHSFGAGRSTSCAPSLTDVSSGIGFREVAGVFPGLIVVHSESGMQASGPPVCCCASAACGAVGAGCARRLSGSGARGSSWTLEVSPRCRSRCRRSLGDTRLLRARTRSGAPPRRSNVFHLFSLVVSISIIRASFGWIGRVAGVSGQWGALGEREETFVGLVSCFALRNWSRT